MTHHMVATAAAAAHYFCSEGHANKQNTLEFGCKYDFFFALTGLASGQQTMHPLPVHLIAGCNEAHA